MKNTSALNFLDRNFDRFIDDVGTNDKEIGEHSKMRTALRWRADKAGAVSEGKRKDTNLIYLRQFSLYFQIGEWAQSNFLSDLLHP